MPYRYIEDKSRVTIHAEGNDIREAFVAGALGLFEAIVDHKTVGTNMRVDITVDAKSESELFGAWLNDLLAKATLNKMVFAEFEVTSFLKVSDRQYLLTGVALGQVFDRSLHKIKKKITKISSPKSSCASDKKSYICTCVIE